MSQRHNPAPSPRIIQMVFKMVSTAWSIWWRRGPQHNSWYNCYFADSLGKIQYLQLSGDSSEPPPQNLLDDIFLFLTFHVRGLPLGRVTSHTRFISIQSVTGCHIENVFMFQRWCLWRKYFLINQKYIFVVTLKYFFRGNHSESGAIIRDCLETRARPPIEFFHCANTE